MGGVVSSFFGGSPAPAPPPPPPVQPAAPTRVPAPAVSAGTGDKERAEKKASIRRGAVVRRRVPKSVLGGTPTGAKTTLGG